MANIDTSVDRLTSFPSAFPDEEERGQVNQVISSLFNKVRSRFAPVTPTTPLTGNDVEGTSAAQGIPERSSSRGEYLDVPGSSPTGWANAGLTAKRPSAGPIPAPLNLHRTSNVSANRTGSMRSGPSNPTSPTNRSFFNSNHTEPHSLLGLGLQEVDLAALHGGAASSSGDAGRDDPPSRPISIQTKDTGANRPPLSRNISSRAPEPAPPLVSTTPVIRSHDYAISHRQPPASGGRSIPEGYPIPGMTPSRRAGNHDLPQSYHRKNPSVSSIHRLRKPSLTGSMLSSYGSSTSLSAMNNPGGDHWDFSAVPGFSIADDVRSIRTIDIPSANAAYSAPSGAGVNGMSSREYDRRKNTNSNPSVTKIIRRLRGEGLSKTYWMADENCKECYDCKSVFTTWRRKHHCRICGQIFCSRCAPNIIKGHRFGHDGMVRVCNLCLAIMDEYDDEEDTRSVVSAATSSFPQSANPFARETADSPRTAQSPFAASQLFSFSRPHTELTAISEQHAPQQQRWRSSDSDRLSDDEPIERSGHTELDSPTVGSMPVTPEMRGRGFERRPIGDDHHESGPHPLLGQMSPRGSSRPPGDGAPFRRAIQEEDNDATDGAARERDDLEERASAFPLGNGKAELAGAILSNGSDIHAIRSPRQRTGAALLDAQETQPHGNDRSFIAFPTSSNATEVANLLSPVTDHRKAANSSIPPGLLRSRLSSRMSTSGLSSVLLTEVTGPNGMWRSRVDSIVPPSNTLQGHSLNHFRNMLRQAIRREGLPRTAEWETVLESLLLKVCASISPNVRSGDSLDARTYVKIKKIPGGKISQSEYVDGIVITKNVAHKQMPRHMISPRIMILTFPLDYHRVENQLVSLEPLMAQEKNYLKHLTKRVTDLRPHVVLVEKTVSRLALDFLLEAKVAVARGVKPSAIQQVARCTQADIIASMDRLALEPKLGRCAELKIQTFEHALIPGFRKTYMRFEGCHEEFGCSLIVRGADISTLVKVKAITDFMVLAVMNLKMEMAVYYDEQNILPPDANQAALQAHSDDMRRSELKSSLGRSSTIGKHRQEQFDWAERQTAEIEASLAPYINTAISTSASVRYPPPAPLAKMGDLDKRLRSLLNERDEREAAQILLEENQGKSSLQTPTEESPTDPLSDDAVLRTEDTATTPTAKVTQPCTENPLRAEGNGPGATSIITLPSEIRLESEIEQTSFQHSEQLKVWAWYRKGHPPDIRPQLFQGLTYLSATVCEGSDKPCTGPDLITHNFYAEDDCTLGQYLEKLSTEAGQPCANKTCTRIRLHHFQVLVHGKTRLQIAVDQFPCPSPGHEDNIITWSYCKVCKEASPTAIIKEETWKFSWAKYLEHAFYPPNIRGGFGCPHDIYRDQIRYFALHNVAIRIHNEEAMVYDVIRPSLQLQTRLETRVLIKNAEYDIVSGKVNSFFDSVLLKLRTFDTQLVETKKMDELRSTLNDRAAKATADRDFLIANMDRAYKLSPKTDVLALNTVYQALQEKAVAWETEFHDLEKVYLPSEKDIRRMTANHLKRLFASQDSYSSSDRIVSGQTVTEGDEEEADPHRDEKPDVGDTSGEAKDLKDPALAIPDDSTADIPPFILDTPMPKGNPLESAHPELTQDAPVPAQPPPIERPDNDRMYDSDSTISALPFVNKHGRYAPNQRVCGESSASGIDAESRILPSRLPRRSKPTPSVADLVKRFQTSGALDPDGDAHDALGSMTPPLPEQPWEDSDSDHPSDQRPRLRRGKTEGFVQKYRSHTRHNTMSDGDRSYAANASRIPTISAIRRPAPPLRQSSTEKDAEAPSKLIRDSLSHAARLPPALQDMIDRPSSAPGSRRKAKPELLEIGKGKAPMRAADAREIRLNGPITSAAKTSKLPPGTRVSTIARHFDRLTREAERDRQKRMNQARGRRARPVGITNAKIQVFNNVRDAFRDESDSASSEADDEDDDDAENDVPGDSGKEEEERLALTKSGATRPGRHKTPSELTLLDQSDASAESTTQDLISSTSPSVQTPSPLLPLPLSAPQLGQPPFVPNSEVPTDVSFKDRLQITLPPFDTSTPLLSVPPTPLLTGTLETRPAAHHHASLVSESEGGSVGQERSSILKTLSNLWAFRTGEGTPLEFPLSVSEHVFADSRIIIREDEPTSIIAFTLASRPYQDKLRNLAHQLRAVKRQEGKIDEASTSESRDTAETQSEDAVDLDETGRRERGTHLNYDFESSNASIFCRIFFAEQFASLRAACSCEDSFLDSLARCIKWDSSGGKSGSAFLKTRDDRFIAKEVSRMEMDALTKFAPSYFEYMRQGISSQRPTALAKIYGFFKIGYRNASTGKVMRMNVLLMENLFYERRFERIYDLKGSMRNRLVQPTGKENQVLLDENLMEIANRQPLYLRDHDKKILKAALWNDTLFLANLNVMDYSLVVGVDSESKELVVGVVDYIRPFTWDKKLESWVKDLGGAARGEPTIVTPKQYKARFRLAMDKYFPSVPDRWSTSEPVLSTEEDTTQTM